MNDHVNAFLMINVNVSKYEMMYEHLSLNKSDVLTVSAAMPVISSF